MTRQTGIMIDMQNFRFQNVRHYHLITVGASTVRYFEVEFYQSESPSHESSARIVDREQLLQSSVIGMDDEMFVDEVWSESSERPHNG